MCKSASHVLIGGGRNAFLQPAEGESVCVCVCVRSVAGPLRCNRSVLVGIKNHLYMGDRSNVLRNGGMENEKEEGRERKELVCREETLRGMVAFVQLYL